MRDLHQTQEWRIMAKLCYHRDKKANAPCHYKYCKLGPINYAIRPSSAPDAYEPDHIMPGKHYPELFFVPDNIQAMHRECNRKKGARTVIDKLGELTRDW